MRCPKCGYISFDQIKKCVRCGKDVHELAESLNGAIPNITVPEYLGMPDEEELVFQEPDQEEETEEIFLAESVDEDAENFAAEDSSERFSSDAVDEEAEEGGADEEREIELDLNFFDKTAAAEPSAPPSGADDGEEEGTIAFTLEPLDSEKDVEPLAPSDVMEEEDAQEIADDEQDLFSVMEESPESDLSESDFDLDLDLGDLDLDLERKEQELPK